MKRILFIVEDDDLKINTQLFYIPEHDKNIIKIKKIEKDLFNLSSCSWHNFHHRFLNYIAIKKLFGRR